MLAFGNITVAAEWPVRGLLFAGGNVEIGAQAAITGVLVAGGEIHLKHTATLTFADLDTVAPLVQITSPPATVTGTAQPPIAIAYSDATSGVDPSTLHVVLDAADITAACQVAAAAAACVPPQPLAAGAHSLSASVKDRAGNTGSASLSFTVVLEIQAPVAILATPANGVFVNASSVTATGTVTASAPLAGVTVNGQAVALQAGAFSTPVTLTPGPNLVLVLATDTYGNVGVASAQVTLDTTPPILTLLQPTSGALINAASVQVTGRASDDNGVAQVRIAGKQVTTDANGSFQARCRSSRATMRSPCRLST